MSAAIALAARVLGGGAEGTGRLPRLPQGRLLEGPARPAPRGRRRSGKTAVRRCGARSLRRAGEGTGQADLEIGPLSLWERVRVRADRDKRLDFSRGLRRAALTPGPSPKRERGGCPCVFTIQSKESPCEPPCCHSPSSPHSPPGADARDPVTDSVVKIHSTRRQPNYDGPWTKEAAEEISGSGVIIDGKRILTNAHVVTLRKPNLRPGRPIDRARAGQGEGRSRRPSTWRSSRSRNRRSSTDIRRWRWPRACPPFKQTVNVYGYPMGGEQLSSPRESSRGSNSPASITASAGCGSRSTPP